MQAFTYLRETTLNNGRLQTVAGNKTSAIRKPAEKPSRVLTSRINRSDFERIGGYGLDGSHKKVLSDFGSYRSNRLIRAVRQGFFYPMLSVHIVQMTVYRGQDSKTVALIIGNVETAMPWQYTSSGVFWKFYPLFESANLRQQISLWLQLSADKVWHKVECCIIEMLLGNGKFVPQRQPSWMKAAQIIAWTELMSYSWAATVWSR